MRMEGRAARSGAETVECPVRLSLVTWGGQAEGRVTAGAAADRGPPSVQEQALGAVLLGGEKGPVGSSARSRTLTSEAHIPDFPTTGRWFLKSSTGDSDQG